MGKEILLVMSQGYGLNCFLLQDEIDQYGWNITRASLTDTIPVCTPFASEDVPIFTTCAGVRVLAASDLIAGKKVMGSHHFEEEYAAAGAGSKDLWFMESTARDARPGPTPMAASGTR